MTSVGLHGRRMSIPAFVHTLVLPSGYLLRRLTVNRRPDVSEVEKANESAVSAVSDRARTLLKAITLSVMVADPLDTLSTARTLSATPLPVLRTADLMNPQY